MARRWSWKVATLVVALLAAVVGVLGISYGGSGGQRSSQLPGRTDREEPPAPTPLVGARAGRAGTADGPLPLERPSKVAAPRIVVYAESGSRIAGAQVTCAPYQASLLADTGVTDERGEWTPAPWLWGRMCSISVSPSLDHAGMRKAGWLDGDIEIRVEQGCRVLLVAEDDDAMFVGTPCDVEGPGGATRVTLQRGETDIGRWPSGLMRLTSIAGRPVSPAELPAVALPSTGLQRIVIPAGLVAVRRLRVRVDGLDPRDTQSVLWRDSYPQAARIEGVRRGGDHWEYDVEPTEVSVLFCDGRSWAVASVEASEFGSVVNLRDAARVGCSLTARFSDDILEGSPELFLLTASSRGHLQPQVPEAVPPGVVCLDERHPVATAAKWPRPPAVEGRNCRWTGVPQGVELQMRWRLASGAVLARALRLEDGREVADVTIPPATQIRVRLVSEPTCTATSEVSVFPVHPQLTVLAPLARASALGERLTLVGTELPELLRVSARCGHRQGEVKVAPGDAPGEVDLVLRLMTSREYRVRAIGTTGAPIVGAVVAFAAPGEPTVYARTDGHGVASARIPEGVSLVIGTSSDPRYDSDGRPVTPSSVVDLVMHRTARLTVLYEGPPVEGQVEILRDSTLVARRRANLHAGSRIHFPNMRWGAYEVRLESGASGSGLHRQACQLDQDEVLVTVP